MVLQLLPDVEKAVVQYLLSRTEVTSLVGQNPDGTANIGPDVIGPYPMLQVLRAGGPSARRLDSAHVVIKVWGAPDTSMRGALRLLARTALAVIDQMPSASLPDAGASWVTHLVTMQYDPDPTTNQQAYRHNVLIPTASK